jgi:hypothetical protein
MYKKQTELEDLILQLKGLSGEFLTFDITYAHRMTLCADTVMTVWVLLVSALNSEGNERETSVKEVLSRVTDRFTLSESTWDIQRIEKKEHNTFEIVVFKTGNKNEESTDSERKEMEEEK